MSAPETSQEFHCYTPSFTANFSDVLTFATQYSQDGVAASLPLHLSGIHVWKSKDPSRMWNRFAGYAEGEIDTAGWSCTAAYEVPEDLPMTHGRLLDIRRRMRFSMRLNDDMRTPDTPFQYDLTVYGGSLSIAGIVSDVSSLPNQTGSTFAQQLEGGITVPVEDFWAGTEQAVRVNRLGMMNSNFFSVLNVKTSY